MTELGRLEQRLTVLYRRHGSAYLLAYPAFLFACVGLLTLGAVLGLNSWQPRSLEQVVSFYVVTLGMVVLAIAVGSVLSRADAAPVLMWAGGARGRAEAEPAWRSAMLLPERFMRRASLVALLLVAVPMPIVAVPMLNLPTSSALPLFVDGVMMIVWAALLSLYALELGLRPVVREIEPLLPVDPGTPPSVAPLRRRLVIGLPLITLTVMAFATTTNAPDATAGELLEALGIAAGLSLTLGLSLSVLVAHSVVTPIEELLEATRRLKRGDLSVRAPLLTADEQGALTGSFNAMVADLRHSADELRASRSRIVVASHEARRQVERDLHDGAQQHLVLLRLKLGLVADRIRDDPQAAELVADASEDVVRALAELRDLAHGIYPAALEREGLCCALEEAGRRTGLPVALSCDDDRRYDPELEAAVYFCCLEALQNVGKHAGAGAQATIRLEPGTGELHFEVCDDGSGYEPDAVNGSMGMQSMADRVGALGGTLRIVTAPGSGTRVVGSVPIDA